MEIVKISKTAIISALSAREVDAYNAVTEIFATCLIILINSISLLFPELLQYK